MPKSALGDRPLLAESDRPGNCRKPDVRAAHATEPGRLRLNKGREAITPPGTAPRCGNSPFHRRIVIGIAAGFSSSVKSAAVTL